MNLHSAFFTSSGQEYHKLDGVMVAQVTNNDDPEGLGRVKVSLPIRESNNETDWIRIATLMGGNNMGSYVIPEVGDEVLVAFHLGEGRIPFIIGSLWSNKNKPPNVNKKNNHIRTFKSRSGHEITFDDDSNGSIEIKTKAGQIIKLDDKSNQVQLAEKDSTNKIEIIGGVKNEITLKSGNTVIKLNNKGEIVLESLQSLKLKSTQITVEASATLDLKAGAALNIKSDGLVNIKGSMVKIN